MVAPTVPLVLGGLAVLASFSSVLPTLRTFLRLPLWLSFVLVAATSLFVRSLIRSSNRISPTFRRQYGLHTLSFATPSAWSAVHTRTDWEEKPASNFFPPLHPSSTSALDARFESLFKQIRTSYIDGWYKSISPSSAFPNGVEVLVRNTVGDIALRAEKIDWSALTVSKILPIVKDHLHHYRTVEHLSSGNSHPGLSLPLPSKSHSVLAHSAHVSNLNPLAQIESHFRQTLERILNQAIPKSDRSPIVTSIAREILVCCVLLPAFEMLCDSDFWNRQIDDRGGRYLHEQKQVNKFLSALSSLQESSSARLDSQDNSPVKTKSRSAQSSSITAASSTRQFEAFIRSIPRVKALGEARRLRADIEREQRLVRIELDSELGLEDIDTTAEAELKRAKKYSKRLERARLEVDARIATLSNVAGKTGNAGHEKPKRDPPQYDTFIDHIDLRAVLSDPSSLAYWLEYMERRNRSRLVQLWLTIEGFKDPLEALGQNANMDETLVAAIHGNQPNNQTVHEDLKHLYDTYICKPDQLVVIPPRHRSTISELASISSLPDSDVRRAKQAMFATQQAVYEQMEEEDWTDFKKSTLFLKASADLSRAAPPRSPSIEVSPRMTNSASIFSPPPIPFPSRQLTAPLIRTSHSESVTTRPLAPIERPVPAILSRQLSPSASVISEASKTFFPPELGRRITIADLRPVPEQLKENVTMDLSASSGSLSSPPDPRRSSNLDFLIGRPSADDTSVRQKLFDDDDDGIAEEDEDEDAVQAQRMEAIQAALNEIIAGGDLNTTQTFHRPSDTLMPDPSFSPTSSIILTPKVETIEPLGKLASRSVDDLRAMQPRRTASSAPQSRKPSKPSAPLRNSSVSSMDKKPKLLFADEIASDGEVEILHDGVEPGDLRLAIPGDMQLGNGVRRLQEKIEELVKQEYLLESLIRQAELTGNAAELRLLEKSITSVRREQRTAIFQKAQFEQQEEESRLVPGATRITIPTAVIASEDADHNKPFVRYQITISQGSVEGCPGWAVARRYNEFWELDKGLRDWAAAREHAKLLRDVPELPPKKLVPNLSSSFIESRRQGLERYLQSLVAIQPLCESPVLRAFLSRSHLTVDASPFTTPSSISSLAPHNIVKTIYKTMATSLDDNLLGPNMLDMMYSTLSRQLTEFGGMVGISSDEIAGLGNSLLPQSLRNGWTRDAEGSPTSGKTASPSSSIAPIGGETGAGSFTAPICDLFVEVFDLKENNWLRRQAIVVILQQFLGSTIERKVRDTFRQALSPPSIEEALAGLQETMWPGGERRPPSTPRTEQEKAETRDRASKKLGLLIPDVAANMIGRGNARRAARRVFGMLQDHRLNQHLMLCIIDEVVNALFPPLKQSP